MPTASAAATSSTSRLPRRRSCSPVSRTRPRSVMATGWTPSTSREQRRHRARTPRSSAAHSSRLVPIPRPLVCLPSDQLHQPLQAISTTRGPPNANRRTARAPGILHRPRQSHLRRTVAADFTIYDLGDQTWMAGSPTSSRPSNSPPATPIPETPLQGCVAFLGTKPRDRLPAGRRRAPDRCGGPGAAYPTVRRKAGTPSTCRARPERSTPTRRWSPPGATPPAWGWSRARPRRRSPSRFWQTQARSAGTPASASTPRASACRAGARDLRQRSLGRQHRRLREPLRLRLRELQLPHQRDRQLLDRRARIRRRRRGRCASSGPSSRRAATGTRERWLVV